MLNFTRTTSTPVVQVSTMGTGMTFSLVLIEGVRDYFEIASISEVGDITVLEQLTAQGENARQDANSQVYKHLYAYPGMPAPLG